MLNQQQLKEAKNKFSQIVKQTKQGQPQYVTVHGKPTVVILSIEYYQKLNQPQTYLSEALSMLLLDEDFDFSRDRDMGRDIDFGRC